MVRYLWLVSGIILYFFIKSNVNETHKYREGGVAFISSLENIYPIFGRWYSITGTNCISTWVLYLLYMVLSRII